MSMAFQSTNADGSPLVLPFVYGPRSEDNVPLSLRQNVWWLLKGEDGAPWTGYFARLNSAKVAVELYQGVWFELGMNSEQTKLEASRVARPVLNLTHDPDRNMSIDSLRAQGRLPTAGKSLVTTGFVTAPQFGEGNPPPTRPTSRSATPHSLVSAFGANLGSSSADKGKGPGGGSNNSDTPKGGGPSGDDPSPDREQEMVRDLLLSVQGSRLEGIPPPSFSGERKDTQRFLTKFQRFAFLNHGATIMNDPMRKTAYFLGFMTGNAEAWAERASAWLQRVTDGSDKPPFGYNVWQITEREFRDAFTDYAAADQAAQDIRKLRMREGRLDEYIAAFQSLANHAGIDLNDPTAMTMFAQGLQGNLAETCVMQDGPENFPQWMQAAQRNHRNWLKMQSIRNTNPFRNAPQPPLRRSGANPFVWRRNNNGNPGSTVVPPKPRDPNAMDVDVIRKATTETEKEKYRSEGRCFACGKQGHISRLCPDKKPQIALASEVSAEMAVPKATTATTSVIHSASSEKDVGDDDEVTKVAKLAIGFDVGQQEKFVKKMTELGADFQ